jgi:hypothetical protein
MKTQTFKVKEGCKKCGYNLYYNPSKLLLETTKDYNIDTNRIIMLTCSDGNSKHMFDYTFPNDFEVI